MSIKPITVRLVAYGQKANVSAIRIRAAALLKEENGSVDESCLQELPAKDVHAEIVATRHDAEIELKEPTAAKAGIAITLRDIHERVANEWLAELPVAKTCVAFATWDSQREGASWQLLLAEGGRWSESRPLKKA